MAGILYLVATPIGNLEDMTFRAVRTLSEVDLIAAEDTRNSIKLLNHFEIKTPMTSYHEFNKYDKAKVLVDKLLAGTNIAVITDAGAAGGNKYRADHGCRHAGHLGSGRGAGTAGTCSRSNRNSCTGGMRLYHGADLIGIADQTVYI